MSPTFKTGSINLYTMKKKFFLFILPLFLVLYSGCSDNSSSEDNTTYDHSKPSSILSMEPDSGGYGDEVIFTGKNLGNDTSQIKIFFNHKLAKVISSDGIHALAFVPRLPGNDCKIKLVMGKDSKDTSYCKGDFSYRKNYQLAYIAGQLGSTSDTTTTGTLTGTTFANLEFLTCDSLGGLYINCEGAQNSAMVYLDEEQGFTKLIGNGQAYSGGSAGSTMAPYVEKSTGTVYYCGQNHGWVYIVDPSNSFNVGLKKLNTPNEYYRAVGYRPLPSGTMPDDFFSWLYNYTGPGDGWLYSLTYAGGFYRFKPDNRVYDIISTRVRYFNVDNYILADPYDKTKIYCSLLQKNIIACIDLTKDPSDPNFETLVCGQENSAGYQDGHISIAKLNRPRQIVITKDEETGDKIMYIADSGNHCIRKFDMDTKMVTTIAGNPEKSGYSTGSPKKSLMNQPFGLCLAPDGSLYISDYGNKVILKLQFL